MIELINGDCLEVRQSPRFKELVTGRNVVIVTDPPFNIGYHYKTYKDRMREGDYYSFLSSVLNGYPFVIIHYPESIYKLALVLGKVPERVVSWVYNSNTAKQHRDIAFFDIKPNFNQVRQPYKNLNDKRIQKRISEGKTGAKIYDWWNINQVKNVSKEKTTHPCQMPEEVMDNVIGILPKEDLLVVDPFMGSGTTGVACIKRGIDFIGVEIDEDYYNVAAERLRGINYV